MTHTTTGPRLSVMILTRNRLDALRACVRSILDQLYRDFEIVILDDASNDTDTAANIAQEFADPRIRPFHTASSVGVAGGRNFLMDVARGEFLVSIDDDAVFVNRDALDIVCRSFDHEPAVGILAFKIMNVLGGQRRPLVPLSQFAITRNPNIVSQRALVSSFRGGGHAIRKRVIQQSGCYRGDMIFGEEEMDLAYRVIQSGTHIVYEPSIEVDHFPLPSEVNGRRGRGPARTELFYHVRNRAYLAYRYLPSKYLFPYVGIWAARYAWASIRQRQVTDFVRGALSTPRFLRGVRREVLGKQALAYLTQHGGRLWY
jgi:GT2 family glycosyltransferase